MGPQDGAQWGWGGDLVINLVYNLIKIQHQGIVLAVPAQPQTVRCT